MNIHQMIKFNIKVIFFKLILILSLGNLSIAANSVDQPLEILFIGNSYTFYNDLPDILYNLASSSGKDVYVDYYAPGGKSLYEHSTNSITINKIREKNWDFIILQGTGRRIAYPDSFTLYPAYSALLILEDLIHNNCAATRIIFFMSWADEDGMTWIEGWTETYEEMQIDIYDKTIEYSNNIGLTIAPIGWTWYKVLEEEDYPLHYLHLSDWNHPSIKGSYLTACVIYSTIFIESTLNIPYYAGLESS